MKDEDKTKEQLIDELVKLRQRISELETESKRAENALWESERRYRALFQSLPIGIGLATLDGEILSCNNAMIQITGFSVEELKKVNLRDTYQNPKERTLLLKRLKKEGCVRNFQVGLKRKDGTPYYASLNITSFTFFGKKVLLTVCEDITKRKRAEKELRESESKLQKQKLALEQKNIALREIIAQVEIEKRKIKDDVKNNVSIVLSPILEKLKIDKASQKQKYVDLIQHHLEGLTSSYGSRIAEKSLKLTPRETEICNLVKGGITSKDISNLLIISRRTVEKHRANIRHKMGISNKDINLTSFLREL